MSLVLRRLGVARWSGSVLDVSRHHNGGAGGIELPLNEFEVSDEWLREIERRVREVMSGEVVCEDWDVIEQRLLAKYPKV